MNNLKVILPLFLILALVQLFVPAKMIWDSEQVIVDGNAFKFKTAPIDPNDPFRGKYITLNFEATDYHTNEKFGNDEWNGDGPVYVSLMEDSLGFAQIREVSLQPPEDDSDYVKARVGTYMETHISIIYPFNRFYMEESKAKPTELVFQDSNRDSTTVAYALVFVKDGNAVIDDVFIDDISVTEMEFEDE